MALVPVKGRVAVRVSTYIDTIRCPGAVGGEKRGFGRPANLGAGSGLRASLRTRLNRMDGHLAGPDRGQEQHGCKGREEESRHSEPLPVLCSCLCCAGWVRRAEGAPK